MGLTPQAEEREAMTKHKTGTGEERLACRPLQMAFADPSVCEELVVKEFIIQTSTYYTVIIQYKTVKVDGVNIF